ncbi:hypothetical protein BKA70DRAFT_1224285 [Coprinopsis sp. MPI-PUGE-AT-0042]|nr:hypothetical protein BKA70DRAFT_1224285 [Coprinopsis sp. MPI-PUGE-AT-0042]
MLVHLCPLRWTRNVPHHAQGPGNQINRKGWFNRDGTCEATMRLRVTAASAAEEQDRGEVYTFFWKGASAGGIGSLAGAVREVDRLIDYFQPSRADANATSNRVPLVDSRQHPRALQQRALGILHMHDPAYPHLSAGTTQLRTGCVGSWRGSALGNEVAVGAVAGANAAHVGPGNPLDEPVLDSDRPGFVVSVLLSMKNVHARVAWLQLPLLEHTEAELPDRFSPWHMFVLAMPGEEKRTCIAKRQGDNEIPANLYQDAINVRFPKPYHEAKTKSHQEEFSPSGVGPAKQRCEGMERELISVSVLEGYCFDVQKSC